MKRDYIAADKQRRGIFTKVGLIIALSAAILAFRWTVHPESDYETVAIPDMDKGVEIIPRTVQEQKRVPPPPAITAEEFIPEDLDLEFTEDLIPEDIEDAIIDPNMEEPIEFDLEPTSGPEKLPPPVEEEEDVLEIFTLVEEMPLFGDCSALLNKGERKQCSDTSILKYLSENIRYPNMARENGIQGTVVIRFIINEFGQITDAEIVREIGGGCGKEALRVVRDMPNWKPGLQRHRKVKVQMNLPVRFKLQ